MNPSEDLTRSTAYAGLNNRHWMAERDEARSYRALESNRALRRIQGSTDEAVVDVAASLEFLRGSRADAGTQLLRAASDLHALGTEHDAASLPASARRKAVELARGLRTLSAEIERLPVVMYPGRPGYVYPTTNVAGLHGLVCAESAKTEVLSTAIQSLRAGENPSRAIDSAIDEAEAAPERHHVNSAAALRRAANAARERYHFAQPDQLLSKCASIPGLNKRIVQNEVVALARDLEMQERLQEMQAELRTNKNHEHSCLSAQSYHEAILEGASRVADEPGRFSVRDSTAAAAANAFVRSRVDAEGHRSFDTFLAHPFNRTAEHASAVTASLARDIELRDDLNRHANAAVELKSQVSDLKTTVSSQTQVIESYQEKFQRYERLIAAQERQTAQMRLGIDQMKHDFARAVVVNPDAVASLQLKLLREHIDRVDDQAEGDFATLRNAVMALNRSLGTSVEHGTESIDQLRSEVARLWTATSPERLESQESNSSHRLEGPEERRMAGRIDADRQLAQALQRLEIERGYEREAA